MIADAIKDASKRGEIVLVLSQSFQRLKNCLHWTQLCCEGGELLECRDACLG
jgi:hypothetical protein